MPVLALALALAMGLVTGCTERDSADKTGVKTKVLRVVNFDALNPNHQSPAAQVFLTQVVALSGGQLKVAVESHFESGKPAAETDEITALADGRYDLAWPSTRAFGAAGITSLQALETPFLITSVSAQRALVTSPVADELLATLRAHGLVGLGLAVGPLRRPMASRPLVTLADWKGVRFRTTNSRVQADAVKALGATPVSASYSFPELVNAGKLDGVEIDIAQYDENDLGDLLPDTTRNVALWAKMFVFTMNASTYDRLTPQQQQWVRQAAQAAVQASVDYQYDEATPALNMCRAGVRFHDASVRQLADLRAAVRPVVDTIAADPVSGPLLRKVESVLAADTGADVPDVPATCLR
ncbi:TRAP transporter substrate-binding protein DctP [Pedococcus sp. KACC 23699]|uniref:TRAP transporter substrate-binding protein DctP n=1 Tax=Pedococcus sp. KACC 23699 TaxID=3149228 RepID=A0AAU7JS49_9MICO